MRDYKRMREDGRYDNETGTRKERAIDEAREKYRGKLMIQREKKWFGCDKKRR